MIPMIKFLAQRKAACNELEIVKLSSTLPSFVSSPDVRWHPGHASQSRVTKLACVMDENFVPPSGANHHMDPGTMVLYP